MDKDEFYTALVEDRRRCECCPGLVNPKVVRDGAYDCGEVGPWTRWQGNLNARVMVVGQDWGDVAYFEKHQGLVRMDNPTNATLARLLRILGVEVGEGDTTGKQGAAFFTNAILCLKSGGLQAKVQPSWFEECAPMLRRQVELVSPAIVVCLGKRAHSALARAFGFEPGTFRAAVESSEGTLLPNGSRAFARYHCGQRILNTHRPLAMQEADWRRLLPWT